LSASARAQALAARVPTHGGAAALIALGVLALLWPVLLGGRVLLPSSLLYFSPPWTNEKPPDVLSYFNVVLSDVPTAYYPWWHFARESLRTGDLPQWNPYALAGTPFLANPQSTLFSPFSVPLWVLPLNFAFGVAAAVQLWLTGFGTYLLGRELGLGFWAALVAGISFGFSPFAIVWLTYPLLSVLSLLPWALWLVERIIRRGRGVDALALSAVLGVALLAGHPGSQVHLYAVVAGYAVLRLLLLRGVPAASRLRRGGWIGAALTLGLALGAVTLVPTALSLAGTVGVEVRTSGALTVPREAMRTLFFPDWWGRPSDVFLQPPYNYNEGTIYAGAVALLLAVLALVSRESWRLKLPFALLALVGFQAAFALEPARSVLANTPVLRNDRNARLSVLVQLAVAVLAGFAVQRLLERSVSRRRLVAVVAGGAVVGIVGLLSAGPSFRDLRVVGNHFRTGTDYAIPDVVQTTTVGWWLLLLVAFAAVALLLPRFAGPTALAVSLVVLIAFDLAHFARGYNPMAPAEHAFPATPAAVRFLRERAGTGRMVGVGITLPPDTSTVYRVRDVRGNDPPRPELRYMRLFRLLNPGQGTGDWLAVPSLDERGRRVLDVLGARWVVFPPGSPNPGLRGLSPAYTGSDATIYGNEGAVPRAYVPRVVTPVAGEQDVLAAVAAPGFVARDEALVENDPVPSGRGSVRVVRDGADEVVLGANLSRPGLVVLSDSLDDGWTVTVDSRKAAAIRVDSVLRGVEVPAGRHTIRWRYRTPGLVAGAFVSALGVLGAAAWGAALLLRRRRPAQAVAAEG